MAHKKQKFIRQLLVATIAAIFAMAPYAAAQKVGESELRFQDALRKQQVEGDLDGAIKLYQSIITSKTTEQVVLAKALLQLAIAYETTGKQSQTLYERIVREFKDQPAYKVARTKLDALRHPPRLRR